MATDKKGQEPLAKLVVSNIWDQTYQILKEKILSRHFGANEKLHLPVLSEQLGVSRTPIRDALNRLEMEGLVRTVPKVGTFVSPVEEDSVNDIMNSRLMIDLWTVDSIAAMSETDLTAGMKPLNALMEQANAAFQTDGYSSIELQSDYDLLFHLAFIRLGGNAKNVELYKSLMNFRLLNLREPHVTPALGELAFQQHLAIHRAIAARDFAAAKEAIGAHLAYSRQNIVDVISRNGGVI